MRKAVWAIVLLLAPLASGMGFEQQDDLELNGHEVLLVLQDGVWTSERWAMVEEAGVQPLRSVRSDALLVWMEANTDPATLGPDILLERPEPAQMRLGLEASNGPGEHRVVLEPRLPNEVVERLQSNLVQRGLKITSTSLDVGGNLPGSLTVLAPSPASLEPVLAVDGVLWIEPVLSTHARNEQAAGLIESGTLNEHPYWTIGLNGTGVVVGVADSGLDADHACFRNATTATSPHAESTAPYPAVGLYGDHHRKILFLNSSIDGNDTPGHSDYRHGTHVIGSLGCHNVDAYRQDTVPSNGSTLAHGTRLVVQDIVSSEGWVPPNVDALLWESSSYGGVVHSNSWGDATTAYTERTGRFDAYARVMPWSLALIAPGNSGEGVLEPANGRNVVAVSATAKDIEEGRWGGSAYGPTEAETDGVFLLAPGANIQSAGADGFLDTNNDNLRLSSGTSMSTPHAAGATAVIQQLYQDGWLVPANAPLTLHYLRDLQPNWADDAPLMRGVYLGEGFTPSGSLLRASLAMATSPLADDIRNGGNGGYDLHNPYDGWGALNLSRLFDASAVSNGNSPTRDTWVHDSYRLSSGSVADWFEQNKGETADLSGMVEVGAPLNQSVGPFLQTGDMFTQRLTLMQGEDVRIRMAFPAQPEPAMVDDLQLRIRLEDGTILLPDELREGEFAPTEFYPDIVDTNDTTAFPPTNETVVGIDIPQSYLQGMSYLDVDVIARFVQPGGEAGSTGLDGDAVGFALVVKGVDRDSRAYDDDDNDGVLNNDDACPNVPAPPNDDADRDGCLDDSDNDGVANKDDACPYLAAPPTDDQDRDGCPDDDDDDGVPNHLDLCPDDSEAVPDENGDGCDDRDQWYIDITVLDVCSTYTTVCSVDVRSIDVKIDGRTVHELTTDHSGIMTLNTHGSEDSWTYIFSKSEEEHLETFSEVELNIEMKFAHTSASTSGRQWGWNDPCWPVGCFSAPIVNWAFDVQLQNGVGSAHHHEERVVSISSTLYTAEPAFATHTFTWSKDPIIDVDGDGFGMPGVTYSGPCTDATCTVERNNELDAFPLDETQWSDRDGDGFGDNPDGFQPDAFPDNRWEWDDIDGDGVGSNADYCVEEYGTSVGRFPGCLDEDGDGFADLYADVCPTLTGTASQWGGEGCPDSDRDGYPDPQQGMGVWFPEDKCPDTSGYARTETGRGCPDRDGDGWADFEDDFPRDDEYYLDTDGDGTPDEEDDFPDNRFLSAEEDMFAMGCCGLLFAILFVMFRVSRKRERNRVDVSKTMPWPEPRPTEQVDEQPPAAVLVWQPDEKSP